MTQIVNQRLEKRISDKSAIQKIDYFLRVHNEKLSFKSYEGKSARYYAFREKETQRPGFGNRVWEWIDLLYALDLLDQEFSRPQYDRFVKIYYSIKERKAR